MRVDSKTRKRVSDPNQRDKALSGILRCGIRSRRFLRVVKARRERWEAPRVWTTDRRPLKTRPVTKDELLAESGRIPKTVAHGALAIAFRERAVRIARRHSGEPRQLRRSLARFRPSAQRGDKRRAQRVARDVLPGALI